MSADLHGPGHESARLGTRTSVRSLRLLLGLLLGACSTGTPAPGTPDGAQGSPSGGGGAPGLDAVDVAAPRDGAGPAGGEGGQPDVPATPAPDAAGGSDAEEGDGGPDGGRPQPEPDAVEPRPLCQVLLCDDGNPCNGLETCDPDAGCQPGVPLECDDGFPCNGTELCEPSVGACVAGTPLPGCCVSTGDCDDGNPCNGTGSCDAQTLTCATEPPAPCDDGNPCNGLETCDTALGCVGGSLLDCSDGSPCNGQEDCDIDLGCISGIPLECSDDNPCNGQEACDPDLGCTSGDPLECSDGNPCNGQESCSEISGCLPGQALLCADDDACNGPESCEPSFGCVSGVALVCSDSNACNGQESCDPAEGCVDGLPVQCSDDNVCNGVETCDPVNGCSSPDPLDCDDDDACTVETCSPSEGCQHEILSCDDSDACTADTCASETGCVNQGVDCDDQDACTTDLCDPFSGCAHVQVECDDGDACTTHTCDTDDGCSYSAVECDDHDACNGLETCALESGCVAGESLTCDDGDPCTSDACEGTEGCVHPPLGCQTSTSTWTLSDTEDYEVSEGLDLSEGKATLAQGLPVPLEPGPSTPGLEGLWHLDTPTPAEGPDSETLLASWSFDEVEAPAGIFGGAAPLVPGPGVPLEGAPPLVAEDLTVGGWFRADGVEQVRDRPLLSCWPRSEDLATASLDAHDAATGCTYTGTVFDGRYIYFAPSRDAFAYTGLVLRYDTHAPFGATGSWLVHDVEYTTNALGQTIHTVGYEGGVFDGRYVYLVPHHSGSGPSGPVYHGRVLRYDTHGAFQDPGSWDARYVDNQGTDLPDAQTVGFAGAVFDGTFVYFVPLARVAGYHGRVLRYLTAGPFHTSPPWQVFEAGELGAGEGVGFWGGVFDGRHVFFAPAVHGRVLRYDTHSPFEDHESWRLRGSDFTEDLSTEGYHGAVFDGRYVYFVPHGGGTATGYHGHVLRFDTASDFDDEGAWSAWDAGATGGLDARGFEGGAFDGRYVFFVPAAHEGGLHGVLLRYDTVGPFQSPESWTALDLAGTGGLGAEGLSGASFDGRHLYLGPRGGAGNWHAEVVRYDTLGGAAGWALGAGRDGLAGLVTGPLTPSVRFAAEGGLSTAAAPEPLSAGWHHVALQREGTELRLALDGEVVAEGLISGEAGTCEGPVLLGGGGSSGRADEVAAWSAALQAPTLHALTTPAGADASGFGRHGVVEDVGPAPPPSSAMEAALEAQGGAGGVRVDNATQVGLAGALGVELWAEVSAAAPGPAGAVERWHVASSLEPSAFALWDASETDGLETKGYTGAAFDGRYVYFVPHTDSTGELHGRVLRHDTQGEFEAAESWSVFDVGTLAGVGLAGFAGAIFDGRHVYLVARQIPDVEDTGTMVRYDSEGPFEDPTSWQVYDASATDGVVARGYFGGVFDGRYVHFVPQRDGSTAHGAALRYDTSGDFGSASAWDAWDASGTGGHACVGYTGATFDGRYVYFVPFLSTQWHGQVLRLDTQGSYHDPASWQAYDAGATGGLDTRGYVQAAFDGRFVYFAPFQGGSGEPHARVLRLDTWGEFLAPSSWEAWDAGGIDGLPPGGYAGALFDGRYLIFVPLIDSEGAHGVVLRLDTHAPFDAASSWDALDAGELFPLPAVGYNGGVFTGRYHYLSPYGETGDPHGRVLRIDTRSGQEAWALRTSSFTEPHVLPGVPEATIVTDQGTFSASLDEPLPPGWHHLALRWQAGSLELWVGGALVAATDAPGALVETPAALYIGGTAPALDEVGLWATPPAPDVLAARPAPYPVQPQVLTPHDVAAPPPGATLVGWTALDALLETPAGTSIELQLSTDAGATWLFWDPLQEAWTTVQGSDPGASSPNEASTLAEAQAALASLPPGQGTLLVRALLSTTHPGSTPVLDELSVESTWLP